MSKVVIALTIVLYTMTAIGCQGGHGSNLQNNTINVHFSPAQPIDWD